MVEAVGVALVTLNGKLSSAEEADGAQLGAANMVLNSLGLKVKLENGDDNIGYLTPWRS